MIPRSSQSGEVIIRIVEAERSRTERAMSKHGSVSDTERIRHYNALVYTELPIFQGASSPPRGQSEWLRELPLASVEQLSIHWGRYQEYLGAFIAEEKAADHMRYRLLETMSPGLEQLFDGHLNDTLMRLWWEQETPELTDLPWELVIYKNSLSALERFSFVRGLPPLTLTPVLPTGASLRVGMLFNPNEPPYPLLDIVGNLPGIEMVPLTEPPREALRRVSAEPFDVLHIVADGVISLASDGLLYLHDPERPELSASEYSATLRNSGPPLLALTSPASTTPDLVEMGSRFVPSVYRAFAYFASSPVRLPSIVTPLGPLGQHLRPFWHDFYTALTQTLSVEEAMGRARENKPPLPIALFLRHSQGTLFQRQELESDLPLSTPPTAIETELQISQSVTERLNTIAKQYGLPNSVNDFLRQEQVHQERLGSELDPWTQTNEGNS